MKNSGETVDTVVSLPSNSNKSRQYDLPVQETFTDDCIAAVGYCIYIQGHFLYFNFVLFHFFHPSARFMSHIIVKHGFLFMGIVTGVIGVSCLCWLHCVFDRFRLTAIKRNFQRDQEIMNKSQIFII